MHKVVLLVLILSLAVIASYLVTLPRGPSCLYTGYGATPGSSTHWADGAVAPFGNVDPLGYGTTYSRPSSIADGEAQLYGCTEPAAWFVGTDQAMVQLRGQVNTSPYATDLLPGGQGMIAENAGKILGNQLTPGGFMGPQGLEFPSGYQGTQYATVGLADSQL